MIAGKSKVESKAGSGIKALRSTDKLELRRPTETRTITPMMTVSSASTSAARTARLLGERRRRLRWLMVQFFPGLRRSLLDVQFPLMDLGRCDLEIHLGREVLEV
jgi:hypothetical protein